MVERFPRLAYHVSPALGVLSPGARRVGILSHLFQLDSAQMGAALDAAKSFCAAVAVVIGLAALIVPLLRRSLRQPAVFYFGAFSFLYSFRILIQLHFATIPPRSIWEFCNFAFAIIDGIPAGLFVREFLPRWRRAAMLWLLVPYAVLSAVGIAGYPFHLSIRACYYALDIVAIVTVIGVIALTSFLGEALSWEVRVLRMGWVLLGAVVVTTNLSYLHIIPFVGDLEPIGVLTIVSFPAYVVVRSLLQDHDRLLSVKSELEVARQIQTSLLPREMPKMPGFEIAGRYVPAAEVAGDFYDFLPVDSRRLGVLIADVSGHGVPAAMVASMVKVALATQAPYASDPSRVLAGLNDVLCGKLRDDQFVTAAYLFLDPDAGGARYASAGHPELLVRQNGEKKVLGFPATGSVLGMWPGAEYPVASIPMIARDRCVLYTDGIIEAENVEGELFGAARLMEFIETHRDVPPAHMSDLLLQAVSRWSGKNGYAVQSDDRTLLVIDCVS